MAETPVNITRTGRAIRVGVLCEVPRGYVALASHGGSCERGCGDHCSRQKRELSHSISPLDYEKANSAWLLKVAGLTSGASCGLPSHRVDKMVLVFRINQETG